MGYYMTQRDSDFQMDIRDFDAALEAVKRLRGRPYAWVNSNFIDEAKLPGAVEDWRWSLIPDEQGNVGNIEFLGEKLGDDEVLFKALAPFVKPGSFIEMQGEDGEIWRWLFDGKTCVDKTAKISWE
jgi:hypothetical protein